MRHAGGWGQAPGAPRRAGGLAVRPLTLLLQGQLALGLDVLQRGGQVAGQAAGAVLGEDRALRRETDTGTRRRGPSPRLWCGLGLSPVQPSPSPCHHDPLPLTQPPCPQTFGEGLRPKVATLSWEEEEEDPEDEGRGPLRARGKGLVASASILER